MSHQSKNTHTRTHRSETNSVSNAKFRLECKCKYHSKDEPRKKEPNSSTADGSVDLAKLGSHARTMPPKES